MHEIKCPNCGEVFVVDKSGYAQIVQQVRDREFERELKLREENLARLKESELQLNQMRQKEAYDKALLAKAEELLSSENNLRLANNKAEDLSIKRLTKNAPSVRQMFEALPKE